MATFDEVLLAWRADCGGKIPIDSELRKSHFRDLIATLEANDLLDFIKNKSAQKRVVDICVNPTSKKLANWKAVVEIDLGVVLHEKFEEIKIVKADLSTFKKITPEHVPYIPPAPVAPVTPTTSNPDLGYTKPALKRVVANPEWEPTTVIDQSVWDILELKEDE